MNSWTAWLILAYGCLAPAVAEEAQSRPADTVPADAADRLGVIPRLAELRIDENVVSARMINLPFPGRTRTLQDILDRLDEWSKNDEIGAVLLNVGMINLSLADVQELRGGIERLRKRNKPVSAFLQVGDPQAYLLACAADEIATAPTGFVTIPGIGALFPFLKGHYQMLGLEFEVITAGQYKYPGFVNRREPDPHFMEAITAVFDGWYGDYRKIIADSRKLSDEAVKQAIDVAMFNAAGAQQRGLIDVVAYYDEYFERLLTRGKMKRYQDTEESLAGVNSLQDLVELINRELKRGEEARQAVGPKIAVLHARGPIVDNNLGPSFASVAIACDEMVKVIDDLRKNKSIKAVVMRVDSPGGSGTASDKIWHALRELNDAKPLVVSMGSMAASGGYYISCPARRIFAQPTTLTGSIGVLGIFVTAQSMLNRSDYEVTVLERGARSLLGSPHRELAKADRAFIQQQIDDFYAIFVDRVAQTRRIPAEMVRKIADGRIWSGRDALNVGLVDELGGLADAIEAARSLANIPPSAELKIVQYPRPSSLGELLADFGGLSVSQPVETLMMAAAPAEPVSFDDQLLLFSRQIAPLCWMAVPDPLPARPTASGAARLRLTPHPYADPLRAILRTAPSPE